MAAIKKLKAKGQHCLNCIHSTAPYELEKDGHYPNPQMFIQCQVPVTDKLRSMLPSSFYRSSALMIGGVVEGGTVVTMPRGEDCPTYENKSDQD